MTTEELLKIEPLLPYGSNRFSKRQRHSKPAGGETTAYKYARLLRDAPELAERVLDGLITVHAAYIESGIGKARGTYKHTARGCGLLFGKLSREEQDKFIKEWI